MSISSYIQQQAPERKELLKEIHEIIIEADKTVTPAIEKMMGKEMILYKAGGVMKYGLSSVKSHMSLHVMPIYGSAKLHTKYEKLLSKAKFQKGCINFKSADEMPANIVTELLTDCAKIDLVAMLQDLKKNPEKKYF